MAEDHKKLSKDTQHTEENLGVSPIEIIGEKELKERWPVVPLIFVDPERAILDETAREIKVFLRIKSSGWVDIKLNWATMNITKRPDYCDRGRYLVQAFHNIENIDKCWIDEADTFPRYYFNFDCMIRELNSFIKFRNLEVNDVRMEASE